MPASMAQSDARLTGDQEYPQTQHVFLWRNMKNRYTLVEIKSALSRAMSSPCFIVPVKAFFCDCFFSRKVLKFFLLLHKNIRSIP